MNWGYKVKAMFSGAPFLGSKLRINQSPLRAVLRNANGKAYVPLNDDDDPLQRGFTYYNPNDFDAITTDALNVKDNAVVSGLFSGPLNKTVEYGSQLNIGCNVALRNFRTKLRKTILQSFQNHLASMLYQIFAQWFNKNKKLLQIEEDNAPFAEENHHSLTLDGIPESCDVDMDAAGRCLLSMPAPHPLGFPEVDASRLFDSMDATMAGWSVPAGSGPPAAAGGAAAALAARGPASSSGVAAPPPPPPPPQASSPGRCSEPHPSRADWPGSAQVRPVRSGPWREALSPQLSLSFAVSLSFPLSRFLSPSLPPPLFLSLPSSHLFHPGKDGKLNTPAARVTDCLYFYFFFKMQTSTTDSLPRTLKPSIKQRRTSVAGWYAASHVPARHARTATWPPHRPSRASQSRRRCLRNIRDACSDA